LSLAQGPAGVNRETPMRTVIFGGGGFVGFTGRSCGCNSCCARCFPGGGGGGGGTFTTAFGFGCGYAAPAVPAWHGCGRAELLAHSSAGNNPPAATAADADTATAAEYATVADAAADDDAATAADAATGAVATSAVPAKALPE